MSLRRPDTGFTRQKFLMNYFKYFKELKETMSKDLNEFIGMRDYQIENINRDRNYKMEPNKNLKLKSIRMLVIYV